jgi:hypothetical protein
MQSRLLVCCAGHTIGPTVQLNRSDPTRQDKATRPGTYETKDGRAPLHMVEQALHDREKW